MELLEYNIEKEQDNINHILDIKALLESPDVYHMVSFHLL